MSLSCCVCVCARICVSMSPIGINWCNVSYDVCPTFKHPIHQRAPYRPAGTIIAQAIVTLACISAEGNKMMAVPDKALASMNLVAGK